MALLDAKDPKMSKMWSLPTEHSQSGALVFTAGWWVLPGTEVGPGCRAIVEEE